MKVLALGTVTEACSVALWTEEGVIVRLDEIGRGHAEEVLGMVDAVLQEAGVVLASLDGIAAGVGPGSFTGVRISVSAAQGLAFGADLPVVPVTSLEALACQVLHGGIDQALACLDARMGEVYWAAYRRHHARGVSVAAAPTVGPAASVAPPFEGRFSGIGRGFDAYPVLQTLPGLLLSPGAGRALPDARHIARLGALRLALGEGIDPAELTPVYVRDKVALTEAERAAIKHQPAV
jgi:tRNA threonylcarbamoyladenosine biosynthesis protein TsaB